MIKKNGKYKLYDYKKPDPQKAYDSLSKFLAKQQTYLESLFEEKANLERTLKEKEESIENQQSYMSYIKELLKEQFIEIDNSVI